MDANELIEEQNFDANQLATLSREELVNVFKELVETKEISSIKEQVDYIKQLFYKRQQQTVTEEIVSEEETETKLEEEANNKGEDKSKKPDSVESDFKAVMVVYRQKRAEYNAAIEAEYEANYSKKKDIIAQLDALINSNDDLTQILPAFHDLQNSWKEIGPVPVTLANDLWKEYNYYQEQFYDLRKINEALREYDFKKNLELKSALIEQAEELDKEEDVVKSFKILQKLHEQWREIGPVARDLRDDVWNKFKDASTVINKRHQAYFENIKAKEQEFTQAKEEAIAFINNIDTAALTTYKQWEEKVKEVIAMGDKFRSEDPAERRVINKVFKQYREACDKFFTAKNEYYKRTKEELQSNLEKKRILVEKAEQLKNSQDWRSTTDKLIALQKEWKTIGPTAKKYSDAIWNKFVAACDQFFANKEENFKSKKGEEQENLKLKLEAIDNIKNYQFTGNDEEDYSALRRLSDAYLAIGHIPYKDKDRVYKQYREASDEQFGKLRSRRRTEELAFHGDRNKLYRQYENLKQQIATYENNIGFFSKGNKKTNHVIDDLQHKIQNLKQDLAIITEQINNLDKE